MHYWISQIQLIICLETSLDYHSTLFSHLNYLLYVPMLANRIEVFEYNSNKLNAQ